MDVSIIIKERSGTRYIQVPWLPEEITYNNGSATEASYDIMKKGEVAIPTGKSIGTYSWSSEFPGLLRAGITIDPKGYDLLLRDWLDNGTKLNLMVTGYPINKNVHLRDYEARATGAFGDIAYSVTFVEDRDIVIATQDIPVPPKRPVPPAETSGTQYTIKQGDTLWGIAKRYLGSGLKWEKIYDANKDIIESTAKKYRYKSSDHGHWIFPGVTITIPSS